MASAHEPKTLEHAGRTLVNRAWIAENTGASIPTVRTWYAKRDTQPEEFRFPEKGARVDREDYFDRAQVETFHRWLKESKKKKVLEADPALYAADPDDIVSINEAATWLGYASPSAIRKYLKDNPGYFPEPAGDVEGPTGRSIPGFRVGDLQDFDRRRNGDNTGRAGSPGGPHATRGTRTPDVQRRIDIATAYIAKAGGYHRGIAAELAKAHEEPTWKWERAVKEARAETEGDRSAQASPKQDRLGIALEHLRTAGHHRGLATQLAAEHGGSERVWQRAVQDARIHLDASPADTDQ